MKTSRAKAVVLCLFISFCFVSKVSCSQDNHISDKKTVFLTGAAGFIGSNFLKYMFDKYPNYHFLVLDALTYAGSLENIPSYIRKSDRFEFHYGSVTNFQIVDKLMSRSQLVVHFAAESHVTRSISDDTVFFDTDVMGTRMMMSALVRRAETVERFIHISTSEVLGTAVNEPMDEDHPIMPRSPYAAAKAGADRLVFAYWCTYDVPALIIRPFNNYGFQQHLEKMIPRFISRAINKQSLTIHGDGSQKRDWLYTLDLARALDFALHIPDFSRIKNQVIHIGSGRATSVLEIAKKILDHFQLPYDQYLKFVGDRPGQVECHISSTGKAAQLLGWRATTSLEDGLNKTIDWFVKNQDHWKKQETLQYVPIRLNGNLIELQ